MLVAFLMHMLPMIVLAVAWRYPWVGAVVFEITTLLLSAFMFREGIQGVKTFLILGAPLFVMQLTLDIVGQFGQHATVNGIHADKLRCISTFDEYLVEAQLFASSTLRQYLLMQIMFRLWAAIISVSK